MGHMAAEMELRSTQCSRKIADRVAERSKAMVCDRSLPGVEGSKPVFGRGCSCLVLCDGSIPHLDESYRLWFVIVYPETSALTRPWSTLGCWTKEEEKKDPKS
jgi:hypothetical protein